MKLLWGRIVLVSLPLIYMAFIWLQSSYFNPESIISCCTSFSKKVILLIGVCLELAHFFEFGFLYLLIILTFLSFGRLTIKKEYIAMIISFLYGIGDEIHQYFVPFRSASIGDLIKDTLGIIIIWRIVHRYYFSNNSKIRNK